MRWLNLHFLEAFLDHSNSCRTLSSNVTLAIPLPSYVVSTFSQGALLEAYLKSSHDLSSGHLAVMGFCNILLLEEDRALDHRENGQQSPEKVRWADKLWSTQKHCPQAALHQVHPHPSLLFRQLTEW